MRKEADKSDLDSWPIGGVDTVLSELQERYLPDLGHLDVPGLLRDAALRDLAVVSSFGTESAVLLHYICSIRPEIPVIFLDTKKHFLETLNYRDQLVKLLGINLQVAEPNASYLAKEDPDGDLFQHDPNTCCTIRKTFSLQDALEPFSSWVSGRKRYQAARRANIPLIERDGLKIKLNPMAVWSKDEVTQYFERYDLPRHPLQDRGYPSIGCEPCTNPVSVGEDSRAGRWAHMPDKTECGIHLGPDGKFVRRSG